MGGRNAEKARVALDAMKKLGFSRKQSTPVLKRLFRLFNQQWEPIEAESYRALADAILDDQLQLQQQANGTGTGTGGAASVDMDGAQDQEEPETFTPEPPSTSRVATTTTTPQSSSSRIDFRASAHPSTTATATAPAPAPAPAGGAQYGYGHGGATLQMQRVVLPPGPAPAQTTPSPTTLLSKQMMDQDFQHPAFFLKDPKPEPPEPEPPEPEPVDMDAAGCLHVQPGLILRSRNRNRNRDASSSQFHDALPLPDRNPHHISGDKNRAIQHHSRNTAEPTSSTLINGTRSQVQEAPSLEIDVASSPGGEVKLSLKCSAHPSKLNMPDLEAVYKMVEDKYLCLDKLLPPDFTVRRLMAEVCQGVVHLGTQHTMEHITQSDTVGNGTTSKGVEGGPASSTLAQKQHLALSRTTHDVDDISKGEENVKIPIANESGRGKCPPSFSYIPGNEVFQNAMVNISLARIGGEDCCVDCFGDCLSAPVPCTCARDTGGEYAYTPDGLVKPEFIDKCISMNRFPEEHHKVFCRTCPLERSRDKASPEPCRGHLVRKFIKECWSKCGCGMRCGNRVVQRGIRRNLQVFPTGNGRGWGLRTQDALPKGAFVCEYAGEILTCAEVHERAVESMKNARYTHTVILDAGWCSGGSLKEEEALCLDGTFYGNVGRFINHRCGDGNLAMVPVQVETPDRHYYHAALFTSRKVEALEELTWDYGIDFEEESERQSVKVFECLCGSKYCRGSRQLRHGNGNGKKRSRIEGL